MADAGVKTTQYEFTVEGTYYSGTKNNKVHRPFKPEKFLLPSPKDAQHTIMRKLLAQRLITKYDDFVSVRTCNIIDQKTVTVAAAARPLAEIPIAEMNLSQLGLFAVEHHLGVQVQKAGSVMEARKMVSDALDDKHLLQRQQNEEAAKRKKEQDDKAALEDLSRNPNALPSDGESAVDLLDQLGTDFPAEPVDPLKDLE